MPPAIGLVLGAGGPVGHAFHGGVLAALAEGGWDARDASLIIGTSIGAVTGALLRAGMSPLDLYARAAGQPMSPEGEALVARGGGWPTFPAETHSRRSWAGPPGAPRLLATLARHPNRARPGLVLGALARRGTVSTAPISDGFARLFGASWPGEALWLCSVELDRGQRVVFGAPGAPKVDVGTAVAASCAVPSFFAPVEVDGRRYVDGGVHSPANTEVVNGALAELDALVVSVPMGIEGRPGRGGVDLPGRWLNHRAAVAGLALARQAGLPVALFEPGRAELEVMHYDAFDLTRRAEVAGRARASAAARLAASDIMAMLGDGAQRQAAVGTGSGAIGPT
jgi:NTE family protein